MSKFITLILVSILVQGCCCRPDRLRLEGELSQDNHSDYDEILRAAIEDQVNYYQPAQQSLHTRPIKSLDGIYDFCLDDSQLGFKQKWHSKDLQSECSPDNNFYRMPVPSAFNEITSNRTVRNYIGWLWYQTTVDDYGRLFVAKDGHKYVQFESANYLAIVWVQKLTTNRQNDLADEAKLVGSHVGGHLPFIVNLTEALHGCQDDAPFRLTIAVSNNLTSETIPSGSMLDLSKQVGRPFYQFKPDFDFFHFAGLIGSVNMIQLPHIHISEVRQTRLDFDDSQEQAHLAQFKIFTNLASVDGGHQQQVSNCSTMHRLEYCFELWLKHDQLLVTRCVQREHSCQPPTVSIPFNDSLIWEPANGRLHYFAPKLRARITLKAIGGDGKGPNSTDVYEFPVGFRAELSDRRHKQGHQLQGFGMHQEQLFSGRTMSQPAIMKDIYLLKQWGANIIRSSHYPYSRQFLEACQENGIQVIAECSAVGLKSFGQQKLKLHKQLLREMMQRDHNNAAIIGWSLANEPQSQLKEARPYFEQLLRFSRENLAEYRLDRFLTAAIAQSYEADRIGDLLDVIMVNFYYGWYEWTGVLEAIERPLVDSLRGWARKHPNKRLLVSEYGADTLAGLHSSSDELFSEEFQASLVAEHERVFDQLFNGPNQGNETATNGGQVCKFMGAMVWNFADFSTDVSLLRVGGNKKGIFTQDRRPKLAAHELKRIYLSRLSRDN